MSTSSDGQWMVGSRIYEGFPLYLRYRAGLDLNALQERFPFLAVLTHTFSFRRFDGAPERAYNRKLQDFDVSVTGYFTDTTGGLIVLVETFGGERNYYFYVVGVPEAERLIQSLQQRFPGYKLELSCSSDPAWEFLRKYRAEYLDGA